MATAVRRNSAPDLKTCPNRWRIFGLDERGTGGLAAAEPYWDSLYDIRLRKK